MIHKNIKLLSWFFFFLDFKLYSPVLILYFSQITGSFALGMGIYSVTFLSQALFEVPTGIFSDLIGRKWTLILGSICSTFAVLSYALAGGYWILVLGGILEGAARSFFSGTDEATLHDSLKETGRESEFGHFQGRISSMSQLGLGISAVVGGLITFIWSFRLMLWLSLVPQLFALLITISFVEPKVFTRGENNIFSHMKEALAEFKRNKKLRYLTLSDVFRFAIGESAFLFRPAFFAGLWPVWAIGLAGAFAYFSASAGFFFAGGLVKKFKELKILIGEVVVNRIINFIGLLFPSVLSPAIMTLTAAYYGTSQIALRSLMQKEFTDRQRATMGSLSSFSGNLTFALFASLLGLAADSLGPAGGLLILNVSMLVIIIFYWKLFKHPAASNLN